mmetsp:Transcript_29836/g.72758  ORF Transcript_29836/g.72758 Transcript_29836/m.72758 type:complete len:96 (+) Transcript_29836:101-388(+)
MGLYDLTNEKTYQHEREYLLENSVRCEIFLQVFPNVSFLTLDAYITMYALDHLLPRRNIACGSSPHVQIHLHFYELVDEAIVMFAHIYETLTQVR